MERIFANLYRCSAPNRRGTSHTYLLVRKEGNLLIGHQTAPQPEDFDEIEKLGGIHSQWICHHHDTIRNGVHEALHARFGCELHHHRIERKGVRPKTKCPAVQFGDEGFQLGDDFEAFYFPSCTVGQSIYRWRCRGKYYLFTSHAIYLRDDKWEIQFRSQAEPDQQRRFAKLPKLQLDYVFPGYTALEEEAFYRFSDTTRKAFARALRASVKKAA